MGSGVVLGIFALLLVRGMTYRSTVDWITGMPGWVQGVLAAVSEYGVLALIALFGLGALHARRRGAAHLARGIPAGFGVVLAYLTSETIKVLVSELRPCRNFSVTTIATCPEANDWSWPSNHATIAVALAVAVLAMSLRLGLVSIPVAALIGVSRVVVGVHYFDDIVAGALLGTTTVIVLVRWGSPLVGKSIALARRHPHLERLLIGNGMQRRAVNTWQTTLRPSAP